MTIEQIARTVILYGDSGNGKSTQVYFVAERLARETGRKVRIISFENSTATVIAPLIASGQIEYLSLEGHPEPMFAMRALYRGDWRGENGSPQKIADWRGKIGAYVIEGLTTASAAMLRSGQEKGRMMREQKTDAFEVVTPGGKEIFNPASQSLYGLVQTEMLALLQAFAALPVDLVLWTAHESAPGLDDDGVLSRGPALVGKAKNKFVPVYAGTVLHLDIVKNRRECYFTKHPDELHPGQSCPAKCTLPPFAAAKLLADYPRGSFPVTLTGGEVAEFLFSLRSRVQQDGTAQIPAVSTAATQVKEKQLA